MTTARFLVVLDADSTLIRNEVIELIPRLHGHGVGGSRSSARACSSTLTRHAARAPVPPVARLGWVTTARFLVVLDADSTLIRNEVIELI
ncbi:hypothetical protein CTI14_61590, partial [Methylobacterium radiotolerans]